MTYVSGWWSSGLGFFSSYLMIMQISQISGCVIFTLEFPSSTNINKNNTFLEYVFVRIVSLVGNLRDKPAERCNVHLLNFCSTAYSHKICLSSNFVEEFLKIN